MDSFATKTDKHQRAARPRGTLEHDGPPPADLDDRPDVETTQATRPGVTLAQGLGWFSLGMGALRLLAPRQVGRLLGTREPGVLLRVLGARDVMTGLGLLGGRRAASWASARVVGDALDLAVLAIALQRADRGRAPLFAAAASVLGVTALDVRTARALRRRPDLEEQVARITHVGRATTIDTTPDVLYRFWRDLANVPRFLEPVTQVEELDATRSRWTARGLGGATVSWEAELTDDRPGELIAWKTTRGPFESSGSVRFLRAPGERGTEVVVAMHYHVPGGVAGKLGVLVLGRGGPALQLNLGLRRLKQIIELGEPMRAKGDDR